MFSVWDCVLIQCQLFSILYNLIETGRQSTDIYKLLVCVTLAGKFSNENTVTTRIADKDKWKLRLKRRIKSRNNVARSVYHVCLIFYETRTNAW